jgi:hypothetical protein
MIVAIDCYQFFSHRVTVAVEYRYRRLAGNPVNDRKEQRPVAGLSIPPNNGGNKTQ